MRFSKKLNIKVLTIGVKKRGALIEEVTRAPISRGGEHDAMALGRFVASITG
jgi:hypothetical protein